ncbi:hemicentin-2-like [Sycon ciliatum]|uniref:hemicentin-2-like n=1 Tax=Sycon ciliatum TaxID=27933 RepID=UPI0031F62F83
MMSSLMHLSMAVLSLLLATVRCQQLQADFYYGTTVVDINTKLVNGSFLDLNALSRPVLACKTSVASTNLHMTHNTARVTAVSGRLGIPNGGDTLFIVAFENVTGADGGQYACHVNNVRTAVINLRVKPFVRVFPNDLILNTTSAGRLTCVSEGYPPPVQQWRIPFVTVDRPDFNFYHELPGFRRINCTASNAAGSTTVVARFLSYSPLTPIVPYPPTVNVPYRRHFVLPCEVTGYPTPLVYSWFEVSPDMSTTPVASSLILANNSLSLTPAQTSLPKTYRCMVRSMLPWDPSTDAQAPLAIDRTTNPVSAPLITQYIDIVTALTPFVTVRCFTTGAPAPRVTLLRNDQEVVKVTGPPGGFSISILNSETTTSVLQVTQRTAQYSMASAERASGIYTCIANNSIGEAAMRAIEVTVTDPLQFREQPTSSNTLVGQTLSLVCNTTGYPPAVYTWFHNSTLMPGATGSLLTVPSAGISSSGTYYCTALSTSEYSSKTFGSVLTSTTANVAVMLPARVTGLTANPTVMVELGGSVNITCNAEGHPPPTISFLMNNATIAPSSTYLITQISTFSQTLSIMSAGIPQQGVYACNASNVAGSDARAVEISVPRKPEFVLPIPHLHAVPLGGVLSLLCNVSGHPRPNVTWLHSGRILSQQIGSSTLRISPVSGDNAGVYTCRASNPSGTASNSTIVDVQEAPVITTALEDVAVQLEGAARRTCVCRGEPQPTLQWYHNGVLVQSNPSVEIQTDTSVEDTVSSTLTVLRVTAADYGHVRCTFTNRWGMATSNASLQRLFAPPAVVFGSLSASNTTTGPVESSIVLSWSVPDTNSLTQPIDNFTVEYWLNGSSSEPNMASTVVPPIELSNLLPGEVYFWRVRAENQAGSSSYSAVETFKTAERPLDQKSLMFYGEIWFYASCGGGGALLLVLIIVLLCCVCKKKEDPDIFDPDAPSLKNDTRSTGAADSQLAFRTDHMALHQTSSTTTTSGDFGVPPVPDPVHLAQLPPTVPAAEYQHAYALKPPSKHVYQRPTNGNAALDGNNGYAEHFQFRKGSSMSKRDRLNYTTDSSTNVSISDTILQYQENSSV